MGYRIAKACMLATSPPLSPNARVVLERMAWATLDAPQGDKPAATYWRGWEYLALPFGEPIDQAARRKVTRAITELVGKGYVKPLDVAHRGQRQSYLITVTT
jgi:hypothetical protein